MKKHQKLQLLCQELNDEVSDIAEAKLIVAIREGKDWAVKYWLDNRGQERGYGVRKLAFKDGEGNMTIPAVLVTDGRMTADQWEAKFGHLAEKPATTPTAH